MHCDLLNAGGCPVAFAKTISGHADAVLYLTGQQRSHGLIPSVPLDLESNGDGAFSASRRVHGRWPRVPVFRRGVRRIDQVPVSPAVPVSTGDCPMRISKLGSEQYIRFFGEKKGAAQKLYVNVRSFSSAHTVVEVAERKSPLAGFTESLQTQRQFVVPAETARSLLDSCTVRQRDRRFSRIARGGRTGSGGTVDFASGAPLASTPW